MLCKTMGLNYKGFQRTFTKILTSMYIIRNQILFKSTSKHFNHLYSWTNEAAKDCWWCEVQPPDIPWIPWVWCVVIFELLMETGQWCMQLIFSFIFHNALTCLDCSTNQSTVLIIQPIRAETSFTWPKRSKSVDSIASVSHLTSLRQISRQ